MHSQGLHNFIAMAGSQLGVVFDLDPGKDLSCAESPYFNWVGAVRDQEGRTFVARVARPNLLASSDSKITNDYQNLGLFETGGTYRLRTPAEQAGFHRKCSANGIRVPRIVFANEAGCLLDFIPGRTLARVLQALNDSEIIIAYLHSLCEAHHRGVVLGDRHSCNTIVSTSNELWHLDFDIEVRGEAAREFEISEAIFRVLHMSTHNHRAINGIGEFLVERATFYSLPRIEFFLRRTCQYKGAYPSGKYARVVPLVTDLLDFL